MDEPRAFQFWIANANNASFISMAIKGQQVFRLNYPLRVRHWHHICGSWNGKSGEWQLWVKGERVGRGFHNTLVGYKIPFAGKLYSGGPSITGPVINGLHFEVTFIQIYYVSLSPGKAHRNHKHHHVHHVDHEGQEITTVRPKPSPVTRPQSPIPSILANGQIRTKVRLNLAQQIAKPSIADTDFTIQTNFVNGQINSGSRLLAQQLLGLNHNLLLATAGSVHGIEQPQAQQASQTIRFEPTAATSIQFVDPSDGHLIFRRTVNEEKSKVQKRDLILLRTNSMPDDPLLAAGGANEFHLDGLAAYGGQQFKSELNGRLRSLEEELSQHDHEAAEDEVKAIMELCSACDHEPFAGAIVFAWSQTTEHLDNVLKGYTVGRCAQF